MIASFWSYRKHLARWHSFSGMSPQNKPQEILITFFRTEILSFFFWEVHPTAKHLTFIMIWCFGLIQNHIPKWKRHHKIWTICPVNVCLRWITVMEGECKYLVFEVTTVSAQMFTAINSSNMHMFIEPSAIWQTYRNLIIRTIKVNLQSSHKKMLHNRIKWDRVWETYGGQMQFVKPHVKWRPCKNVTDKSG